MLIKIQNKIEIIRHKYELFHSPAFECLATHSKSETKPTAYGNTQARRHSHVSNRSAGQPTHIAQDYYLKLSVSCRNQQLLMNLGTNRAYFESCCLWSKQYISCCFFCCCSLLLFAWNQSSVNSKQMHEWRYLTDSFWANGEREQGAVLKFKNWIYSRMQPKKSAFRFGLFALWIDIALLFGDWIFSCASESPLKELWNIWSFGIRRSSQLWACENTGVVSIDWCISRATAVQTESISGRANWKTKYLRNYQFGLGSPFPSLPPSFDLVLLLHRSYECAQHKNQFHFHSCILSAYITRISVQCVPTIV